MTPLKIESESLADRQVQLTVEVPEDQMAGAMHRAARHLSRKSKIAGFRPGKAPYEIILQRYGEEAILDEAIDDLGQEVYRQALADAALDPVAPGTLDDVVSRKPLVFRYTVPLAPEVDLGAYRDVRLPFDPPEVEESAVDEVLEGLRQQQAVIEPAERMSGDSDVIVVDVHGTLTDAAGAEPSTLLDEKGVSLLIAERTDFPFPGVASHLLGRSAGESFDAEYTFPSTYPTETLRERPAAFHFDVQAVKSRSVPEWSDDLARTLGEFEGLDDLRAKARESLEEQAAHQADDEYANKAIQAVVDGAKVVYPPILVTHELDDSVADLDRRLREQRLTLADYLRIEKKTDEELRSELEPQARRRLERALVLGKVVEAEGIEVEAAEIDATLERLAAQLKGQGADLRRALNQPAGRRRIELDLLTDKAVARLVQIAKGEAPPLKPSETPGDAVPAEGEALS
jgi:trigger factor